MPMTIQYETHVEGDILHVTTSGFDESLEDVIAYGEAVVAEAKKYSCTRILIDESDLVYRLSTVDTYELADYYAKTFRGTGKVALVTSSENLEDAKFWETAVRNRGLFYRIFTSKEEAEAWLDRTA